MSTKKVVTKHPCIVGELGPETLNIISNDPHHYNDFIARVDFGIGPYRVFGNVTMILAENYDLVAFALLREMFGLEFPRLAVVEFAGINYIVSKDFPCRELRQSDYMPPTNENFRFRYQLCLIIYFCRFVGVDLRLPDIQVLNGVPYIWRINTMGSMRAETISELEFCLLFETDNIFAKQIFVEDEVPKDLDDYNVKEVNGLEDFNLKQLHREDLYNCMKTDSNLMDESLREQFESPYQNELRQAYGEDVALPPKSKMSMLNLVIKYFREIDFDLDTIRECLYLRDGAVRSSRGNRVKYPLSKGQRRVEKLLTQNHAILRGPFPYRIFRRRSGK